ncbi:amino acid dehydrogenase [Shewanella sp. OPT22]|nr:amino acid dehydrogenase [Shewanella sp. OPT22]
MAPEQKKQQRVCVIGAGIIGVTAAYQLQKHGFEVTLVDKEGVASGASYGNAGHFATEQVFPLADHKLLLQLPKMLLDPLGPIRIKPNYFISALPWFYRFILNMFPNKKHHNTQAIKALNALAISEIKQIASEVGCSQLIKLDGNLVVFENTPLSIVVREWRAYSEAGVAVRLISGEEARKLEPELSEKIEHALFFTETGHTSDPKALCLAIFEKFKMSGGRFLKTHIADVTESRVQVSGSDNQGASIELEFDKTLITAGAWSKPICQQVGHNTPLDTERGYHLMLQTHLGLTRPVASYERKFIITPMVDGTRLAGMVEFGGLNNPATAGGANRFKIHGQAIIPRLKIEAHFEGAEEWMGFRPSFPDSLPVISGTKNENIFASFGHQHLGLTWSAISAKLITQKIMGKEPDIELSPYRIDRF